MTKALRTKRLIIADKKTGDNETLHTNTQSRVSLAVERVHFAHVAVRQCGTAHTQTHKTG